MSAQQLGKCLALGAFVGALFLLPSSVSAFSLSIKEIDKQSLSTKEEEVKVTLTIKDLPAKSYFRTAFQKSDNDAYFGFIKNHKDEWVKIESLSSQNCTGYYYLDSTPSAEITINLIIGAENETENGQHLIKAHRFTDTCKSNNKSDNSLNINFDLPQPSPTPTPTPTPTPSPTPTPTPSPTPSTSAQVYSPTPKPSLKSSPMPTASASAGLFSFTSLSPEVLGASSSSEPAVGTNRWLAWVLIGLGAILIAVSGAVFGYNQFYALKSKT